MSQFSLSWNSYKANICSGLCSLQQNEEFVDMTLAADGHFVKVHQVIISLASPYLKELIKSAPCSHPVIFLNKISYPILCSILEYVYSGEVQVNKETLNELLMAGRELHIKGLDEMKEKHHEVSAKESTSAAVKAPHKSTGSLVDRLRNHKKQASTRNVPQEHILIDSTSASKDFQSEDVNMADPFYNIGGDSFQNENDDDLNNRDEPLKSTETNVDILRGAVSRSIKTTSVESSDTDTKTVQYTLSNQGSLQLVLNRFVYYLRYCHKNSNPPMRLWRCVDYNNNRCPASVTTKDDMVVQRISAHKHPFHDKRIVKKIRAGVIFTAIKDAESQGRATKKNLSEKDKSQSDGE